MEPRVRIHHHPDTWSIGINIENYLGSYYKSGIFRILTLYVSVWHSVFEIVLYIKEIK